MSQSKTQYPVLTLRCKDLSRPPTGANLLVELDGVALRTASYVKVACHARKLTKVTIEMYAHVDIETIGELSTTNIDLTKAR